MAKSYDEKRQLILDTAAELFAKKGFEDVSVMDICNSCNITKPTFYKYVVSKESILTDIFKQGEKLVIPNMIELRKQNKLLPAFWTGMTGTLVVAENIGCDLLKSYIVTLLKQSAESDRFNTSLQIEMESIIEELQKQHLIKNMTAPKDIYKLAVYLNRGLLMMWAFNGGTFDLTASFRRSMVTILGIKDGRDLILRSDSDGLVCA